MKYDIFILYGRDDAKFVRSLAKGFEKLKLSVLYKESLPRPVNGSQTILKDALHEGFDNAIYGIIFISKTFMKTGFSRDDLEYLSDILLMENQVMHALWYYVTNTEVSEWYPRLAMNIAMRFPPETVDSISRKFQVKFAGSPCLQQDALRGFHPKIQYISPKINAYRPPESQMPDHRLERSPTKRVSSVDEVSITSSMGQNEEDSAEESIDDQLISDCFTFRLREEICKRLDVYLKGLCNWKDLAAIFQIRNDQQIRDLIQTKEPTCNLLNEIAAMAVSVGQFKGALKKIERYDVIDCINKHL